MWYDNVQMSVLNSLSLYEIQQWWKTMCVLNNFMDRYLVATSPLLGCNRSSAKNNSANDLIGWKKKRKLQYSQFRTRYPALGEMHSRSLPGRTTSWQFLVCMTWWRGGTGTQAGRPGTRNPPPSLSASQCCTYINTTIAELHYFILWVLSHFGDNSPLVQFFCLSN